MVGKLTQEINVRADYRYSNGKYISDMTISSCFFDEDGVIQGEYTSRYESDDVLSIKGYYKNNQRIKLWFFRLSDDKISYAYHI